MIGPIQYSLTYPERSPGLFKPFDFIKNSKLEFFEPDKKTFRCLSLAYEALKSGGTLPCYMNAANEILVERFLKGEISWKAIGIQLEELMNQHQVVPVDSLETILAVDALAREEAARSELILSR
jgi:1-deoxy-D-xylulose-5-phosphate reductoisomerase